MIFCSVQTVPTSRVAFIIADADRLSNDAVCRANLCSKSNFSSSNLRTDQDQPTHSKFSHSTSLWRSHQCASAGGQPSVSHVGMTHFHCICVHLASKAHHRWTGSLAAPYHLSKISNTQQKKNLQTSRENVGCER